MTENHSNQAAEPKAEPQNVQVTQTPANPANSEPQQENSGNEPEISEEQKAENIRIAEETKKAVDEQIAKHNEKYEKRIAFLKDLRADIRGMENAIKNEVIVLSTYFSKECISEARKRLIEARHWCGKMLGLVGSSNPYKNEDGTDKKELVPTQDPAKEELAFNPEMDLAARVRDLRSLVEHVQGKFNSENPITGDLEAWYGNHVIDKLQEARMWLGEALAA